MTELESPSQWLALSATLAADGYTLFQWQYGTHRTEGLQARFWASGKPDVEVVTHNEDVETEIIRFNGKNKK